MILDAALTRFAIDGFDRATTAAICREARIGSGTFFHYFPTKLAALVAILEMGTAETRQWFTEPSSGPGSRVVMDYVDYFLAELADPRIGGFVQAVGALINEPDVAHAIRADSDALSQGLTRVLQDAQKTGHVRTDCDATTLATWTMVLLDGFLGQCSINPNFSPETEGDHLKDAVSRLLAP